ncbi:DsrE family protein [Halosolutus halophilus]|uniref:DsrE family protein n=1 Tax=Halosolutus halophilus TaxID=1552990 RepID=UPI0022350F59|nr:DsrE family protein [Halosolutus halophilus]
MATVDKIGIIVYSDDPKSLAMAMNLGQVALAMETEVVVYFTFDGLSHLLSGEKDLGDFERMVEAGVPDPYGLLADFVEAGDDLVTTVACTTTIDMLGWDREAMDESLTTEFAGAAAFLDETADAAHVFSFG